MQSYHVMLRRFILILAMVLLCRDSTAQRAIQAPISRNIINAIVITPIDDVFTSIAFSPDGKKVVVGCASSNVRVYDAISGNLLLTLKGHSGDVRSVAFSKDGKKIVTGSWDKTAKIWDAETGKELLTLTGDTQPINSVAISADGKRIVTASGKTGQPGEAKIWDVETGKEILALKGHSNEVTSAAFSLDSKRVVTGSEDKTVIVWDAETGKKLLTMKGHTTSVVWCVRFSPDGSKIVSSGDAMSADMTKFLPGEARTWDAKTGANLHIFKGREEGAIFTAEFSPNGQYIVTAGEDMTIRLWETESGKE